MGSRHSRRPCGKDRDGHVTFRLPYAQHTRLSSGRARLAGVAADLDRRPRPDDHRRVRARLSGKRRALAREAGTESALQQSQLAGPAICPTAVGGQGAPKSVVRPRNAGVGIHGTRVATSIVQTPSRDTGKSRIGRLPACEFGVLAQASVEPRPESICSRSSFPPWQWRRQSARGKFVPRRKVRSADGRGMEPPDRRSAVSLHGKPGRPEAKEHQPNRLA